MERKAITSVSMHDDEHNSAPYLFVELMEKTICDDELQSIALQTTAYSECHDNRNTTKWNSVLRLYISEVYE
jgi:hypothetical protein